jgi:hypothetical protein
MHAFRPLLSCLLIGAGAARSLAATAPLELVPVTHEQLCVTEGLISGADAAGWWPIDAEKIRAYVDTARSPQIEARFMYLGGTDQESRLGSGTVRRQLGLKLRAQDACNLIYVMWRFEPRPEIVVSIKSNPAQHSSSECGNRGYRNIRARQALPVPVPAPGSVHSLRAELSAGAQLRVFADGVPVWEGMLGPEALMIDGPVGFRSDNVRLKLALRTVRGSGPPPPLAVCRAGAEE